MAQTNINIRMDENLKKHDNSLLRICKNGGSETKNTV